MSQHAVKMHKPNFKIDEIVLILIVAVLAIIVSFYTKDEGRLDAEKIAEIISGSNQLSFIENGVVISAFVKSNT